MSVHVLTCNCWLCFNSLHKTAYHTPLRMSPHIKYSYLLDTEGIVVSRRGVSKFIERFLASVTIARRPGTSGQWKTTEEVTKTVEEAM